MGPEGTEVVPYLARKYGRMPEQIAQTQARIRDRGAAVRFKFGERKHVWNTFDAHRMLHWAGLEGRALELERYWLQQGVSGVPLLVVNDQYAIEGAQPPEGYEQALRQIAQEQVRTSWACAMCRAS